MAKNGNITGQVFDKEVINQITARQNFLGARYRTDAHIIYGNNSNAFLRLASSINVGTSPTPSNIQGADAAQTAQLQQQSKTDLENQGRNQLKLRNINESYVGDKLAKACVLFGGTVGINDTLNPIIKYGIYGDNTGVENDPIGTIAAYGWGGIGSKGYAPMPSIESAEVSFYNRGALAKASVKIKVYSVEQLQIFDILYFRIGYTMLLEWGHNIWLDSKTPSNPPDPNNPTIIKLKERTEFVTKPFQAFFKEGTTQQDIIKKIQEQRLEDCYNYDGMLGKVTNFTWRFNDDGSYDIDLNLVGMGDIIETLKINTTVSSDPNKKPVVDPDSIEALNKKSEGAALINQQANNQNTTASEQKQSASTTYETTVNNARTSYSNIYSKISSANISKYNLSGIAVFGDTAGAANANISRINTAIQAAFQNQNLVTVLRSLKTEQNKVKGAATAKSEAEAAADLKTQQALDAIKASNSAQQAVEKQREINSLAPNTSVETKLKTELNRILYEWRQQAREGADKNNLLKLLFTAQSANSATTGAKTLELNYYYVRLGFLLNWIQNNLLYYDDTKKAEAGSNITNPNLKGANAIFEIDIETETNFCLRFPSQFSSDPRVCVIPSKYTNKDFNISWDILTAEIPNYFVKENDNAGKIMNMFVNIDYIAGCVDHYTDVNGKTNLHKFLTEMLDGINDALGNVNKLEPIFDPESNKLKILEGSSIDRVEELLLAAEQKNNEMAVFQVYGIGTNDIPRGSFITNVDFQVQLPPNMASMATISAQAGGNVVGENATGLSNLNKGFTDRLVTRKLDAKSIEGATVGKADPTEIFKTNIQQVSKAVNTLYGSKQFALETVDSVRSLNRDISLYLTGKEALDTGKPAPFFIPFNLSLDMKGLSGMKNYERFSITEQILPYSYRSGDQGGVIDFLIKGISHTIGNNEWTTKIESLTVSSKRKGITENLDPDFSFLGDTNNDF
jgi:hypothetical protein